MANPDLIRKAVQAVQPSSGVSLGDGVAEIGSIGASVSSALGKAQSAVSAEETRKRKENAEMADADMIAFTAFMSETSSNYQLALAETSDTKEIEKITAEYEGDVDIYIGDPSNMRNGISRKQSAEIYKKNKPNIFTNPGKQRVSQLNRRNSIAKYEGAIVELKTEVFKDDNIFKRQATDLYSRMGVYTNEEIKTLVDRDMKQKEVDKAKFNTAGFENDLNEHAIYAANIIGSYKSNTIMDDKEKEKNVAGVIKDYEAKIKAEFGNYRKAINESKLNDLQKRHFLSKIDTQISGEATYLKSLSKEIDKAQAAQMTANENNLRQWRLENGDKPFPLKDFNDRGTPRMGLLNLRKNLKISQSYLETGMAALRPQAKSVEQDRKNDIAFDRLLKSSGNIESWTDPLSIADYWAVADGIKGNSRLQTRADKFITNKTTGFIKDASETFGAETDSLKKLFATGDVDIADPRKRAGISGVFMDMPDVDVDEFIARDIMEQMNAKYLDMYRDEKIGPEQAKVWLREQVKEVTETQSSSKILWQYISPAAKDVRAERRAQVKKDQVNQKITERLIVNDLTGDEYLYDEETKKTRKIHEGRKGIRARQIAETKKQRLADEKQKAIDAAEHLRLNPKEFDF